MRRVGEIGAGGVAARLLYGVTIGTTGLLAVYAGGTLILALAALLSGWWPDRLTVDTPLPGFTLPTATSYGRLIYLVQSVWRITLLAGIFVPLLGLLRSISKGTPFVAANVVRLRLIAATFAVAVFAQAILPLSGSVDAMIVVGSTGSQVAWTNLFAVLALLIAAELFQEGVRLRDDVDATI